MIQRKRLSKYILKKIISLLCLYLQTDKTSKILNLNRNTINKYFMLFRKCIYLKRNLEMNKLAGLIELDESYFDSNLYSVTSSSLGTDLTVSTNLR